MSDPIKCDSCGGKCASLHPFCVLQKDKPHDHVVKHYCVTCAYEIASRRVAREKRTA